MRIAVGLLAVFFLASSCGITQASTSPADDDKHKLVVTGAGGALERLTSEAVSEQHPAISPDGRTLLFEVRVYDDAQPDVASQMTLVAVDPNTRARRQLYTSTNSLSDHPAWLPDQSSFVYASNSPGAWSLVRSLTAAPNAAVTVVAAGEIAPQASWPSIAPDGQRVAFSAVFNGVMKVVVIDLDGSHMTILGEGGSPAWGPDGDSLAFARSVGGSNHLFIIDPRTGTGLVQLTSGEFEHDAPSWSPDGKYVVFSTNRGWDKYGEGGAKRIRNLYILTRDGTGLTQLTDGDAHNIEPYWGRDGWIYFASNQAGNLDVWRVKPTGQYAGLEPWAAPAITPPPASTPPAVVEPTTPPPTEPATTEPTPAPVVAPSGCTKDTDCKGERVCEAGSCVDPKPTGKKKR